MGPEAVQLGMMAVSLGFALENFLGKQAFPPKGQETFCIQVFGVNRPETHLFSCPFSLPVKTRKRIDQPGALENDHREKKNLDPGLGAPSVNNP
jgi:hypothetical protein